jgi:hypothetical protein
METMKLGLWDEACGTVMNIITDGPYTILDFGKFKVRLNPSEASALRYQLNENIIGCRISLLRTDLPEKQILLRKHSSN